MTADDPSVTLAAQAATWVPPWSRQPEPDREPEPEPVAVADVPAVPEAEAEAEAEVEVELVVEAEAEPAAEPDAAAESGPEPARERVEVEVAGPKEVEESEASWPAALEHYEPLELSGPLEAILLVVDEPVSEVLLAQVLEQPTERVVAVLAELAAEYTEQSRGFELRRVAGGWRLYTRGEYASYVERFVLDGQQVRLTQAALETLAVIAYKQPVTRSRISAIRGVNCDGVVRTLVSRSLIEECGSEADSGAFLYRTTTLFLEKLGLDSIEELPPLAPFLPDDVNEIADAQG